MKRITLVAVLLAVMVLGIVAYAIAAPNDVVVTARVNPKFEMTLSQNAVSLTTDPGATIADSTTHVIVKSNKAWDFSKTAVVDPTVSAFLTEGTSIAAGTGLAKGAHDIVATYTLDLTPSAAWEIDPEVDYTSTYTYTAVQQP